MPHMESERPLVLVADPAPDSAALIARQLAWAGYDVVTAGDGAEAIAVVAARRPKAAIIEVTMPELSGYEVVRQLRCDPANRLMPVILISARAGKLDRDFAFTVGADEYFKKPFRSRALVERIEQLNPVPTTAAAQPIVRRPQRPDKPSRQPALAG
ncbi:MAG: hypothetical protein NVSMB25_04340 [Thermoleophilaceae bacterium]